MKFKLVFLTLVLFLTASIAQAGPLDAVKEWLTGSALLAAAGFVMGIGIVAVYTDWLSLLLVAIGNLGVSVFQGIILLGLAIFDHKVTKEELAQIRAVIPETKRKYLDLIEAIRKRPKAAGNA